MNPESISRAIDAYNHAAKLVEDRLAISGRVDGECSQIVSRALAPVAETLRSCAAALRRNNAVPLALMDAEHD